MRHLGLFEGIGGFSLAARWVGWETVAWCEWNEFCQKVLRHHFPEAQGHGDITKTDFTPYANGIDIVTGGFPCQPFSTAGKQLGEEDERFLWHENIRAIREIKPRWVVGENVRGITGPKFKQVFEQICASLESEGYKVQSFNIPASAVAAPHEHQRIWFIAYSDKKRLQHGNEVNGPLPDFKEWLQDNGKADRLGRVGNASHANSEGHERRGFAEDQSAQGKSLNVQEKRQRVRSNTKGVGQPESVTNTERIRSQEPWRTKGQCSEKAYRNWEASWVNPNGGWPTEQPVCVGDDGLPNGLADHALSKAGYRTACLEAGGNAIVPQMALMIYRSIQEYEALPVKTKELTGHIFNR